VEVDREAQELRYELIQLEHEMRALQDELTRAMEAKRPLNELHAIHIQHVDKTLDMQRLLTKRRVRQAARDRPRRTGPI